MGPVDTSGSLGPLASNQFNLLLALFILWRNVSNLKASTWNFLNTWSKQSEVSNILFGSAGTQGTQLH